MTLVAMAPVCPIDGRLVAARGGRYRRVMPDEPVGFDLDIGKILRDTGLTGTRRRRPSTTTADAAIRRAVRAELAGVEKALRTLATEVVRLRRANEDLAEKVARQTKR
jgi:hypothetical protein